MIKIGRKNSSVYSKQIALFSILTVLTSVFSIPGVLAAEGDTASKISASGVETLIIVNGGDVNTIDAAIASGISHDLGVPVLFANHGAVPEETIKALEGGIFKDVSKVVILGGEAVISKESEKALINSGITVSGNFDVTRISGTTGTGTALEAVKYFYGPEVLDKVAIVPYEGDGSSSSEDVMHLAAQLGAPVIPIPSDAKGLPADVQQTLEEMHIDKVDIFGDFSKESELKTDLQELNVLISSEINGNEKQVEQQLQDSVIANAKQGDKVIIAEEGTTPPIAPGQVVVFWKDENNDNIDDDSGSVLDSIGRGLNDKLKDKKIEIEYYGDKSEEQKLKKIQEELKNEGINVEIGSHENTGKFVDAHIGEIKENLQETVDSYNKGAKELADKYTIYQKDFENEYKQRLEQFKSFYVREKASLSEEELKIGAKIIEECNKKDAVAGWKLMTEFSNEYKQDRYQEGCSSNSQCVAKQIEYDKIPLEDRVKEIVGAEKASEVSALNAKDKIALLELMEFTPPGKESEFSEKVQGVAKDVPPSEVASNYVKRAKEEAYGKYAEEIKKEYEARGKKDEAAKVTVESVKKDFDKRIALESEAYLAGLVDMREYVNPERRATVYEKVEAIHSQLSEKSVGKTSFLSPEDWKNAYNSYSSSGRLSESEIKKYEAAMTAYQAWEKDNAGVSYDPVGGSYNSRTGQYTYTDPSGKVIAGVYDSTQGHYTYTNEEGKLITGHKTGEYKEYSSGNLPAGWNYDSSTGIYERDGKKYIPPAEYNPYSGKHEYAFGDKHIGCGATGCSEAKTPEGYERNTDGSYSRVDYKGEVSTEFKPGTYYDPKYGGYIPAASSSSTTGGTHTDPYGNSWTQKSDGTWSSGTSSGTTSSTSGTSSGATWTQKSDGSWESSSGQAYVGPTRDASSYSGSYSYGGGAGGTGYSGSTGTSSGTTSGTSGSYSGSYSGGYTGGTTSGTAGSYGSYGSYGDVSGSYSGGGTSGGGSYSGGGTSGGGSYSGGGTSGGGSYSGGAPASAPASAPAPTTGSVIAEFESQKGFLRWLIGG